MSRPATTNLKVNPPVGQLPVLQYCAPDQLLIDDSYQRSLEAGPSQALIRRIAVHWDWGLCQPLFVARRSDGGLYVVDGQHRLAAARLRGDLWQLPCVVTSFTSPEEEAAAFVALNQERRPLNRLQIFKAALAAGDFEAAQIAAAIKEAGLRISSSTNLMTAKPGALTNVAGLQSCYRAHGLQVFSVSLAVLARAYPGQVLRYAGTIFPGISAIVAEQLHRSGDFAESDGFALLAEMVGGAAQEEWAQDIKLEIAAGTTRREAATSVFRKAWDECNEAMLDEAA